MDFLFSINTYIGIALGGLGAVVYFSWTGTQLKWKK